MASFSNEVKGEICRSITDTDKKYACLYGIILYSRNLSENRILIHTESENFYELMQQLMKNIFGNGVFTEFYVNEKKNGGMVYNVDVSDKPSVEKIFEKYSIDPKNREINLKNIVNNSLNSFLAGVFFACGSVTDPNKEYHLEFTVPTEQLYYDLDKILIGLGITAGKTERKNNPVIYIKDSENIEDILTFIGAQQCTIDLMNVKIYKDVRNKANRIANCDNANINKAINAASKQIKDINVIINAGKFDTLTEELKETAELRLKYPEFNLQEIGESLSKPIGRSGVTRRFQKIAAMAEKILNN